MHLIYNGISIDVLTVEQFDYEVVMDDTQTDLLFQRVRILVTGIINGQVEVRQVAGPPISVTDTGVTATRQTEAIRTRPTGVPNPGAVGPPDTFLNPFRNSGVLIDTGNEFGIPYGAAVTPPTYARENRVVEVLAAGPGSPVTTALLVQKRLTEPRGKLFVFADLVAGASELLLFSPDWPLHCDLKNGPKPTHFSLTKVMGEASTFIVQFGVETYIHSQRRTDPLDPLLSNRFRMTHHVDEDSFLTIHVNGIAHFDVGRLNQIGANPDSIRPRLFLPVPAFFTRTAIEVEGTPDGSGVSYSFEDRQQHTNFAIGRYFEATRIEAIHEQSVTNDYEILAGAVQMGDRLLNRAWQRDSMRRDEEAKREAATRKSIAADARRKHEAEGGIVFPD